MAFEHSEDPLVKEASTWVCRRQEGSGVFYMLSCFVGTWAS